MKEIIYLILLLIMAVSSIIISFYQFRERGPLLNNAFLYASGEERRKMNKKPHYRQSGIVFALAGIIFLIFALDILFKTSWLFYAAWTVVAITIVYAIVSSIMIEKKHK